ncbi:hypothetical protein Q3A66_12630 [Hymenobacter sp. BT770]|nr:hypothetical protein [Hymenobacter sp. BT770]MDO3415913.1 hypothetical protein [Hymenobacter sp. BT770]
MKDEAINPLLVKAQVSGQRLQSSRDSKAYEQQKDCFEQGSHS